MISDEQKIADVNALLRHNWSWRVLVVKLMPGRYGDIAKVAAWDRVHEVQQVRRRMTGETR